MMRALFILGTLLTLSIFTSFTTLKSKRFKIEIIQDGKAVDIKHHTAELEKRPFKIKVTLKDLDGIYLCASFKRNFFDTPDNRPIKDFQYYKYKTRAESNFNEAQLMHTSDEYVSYLFYDPEMDWHRFDKAIQIKGNNVIATKTIRQFSSEEFDSTFDIADIDKDLFLFFVETDKYKTSEEIKNLGRLKLRIKWK